MNAAELRSLSRVERAEQIFNFNPVGWQRDLLESDSPDKSVNCSRQVGKSETGGLIAADACLRLRNETVAVLARWQDTADEMFSRLSRHLKNSELSNEQLGLVTDNSREKKFDNGTRAICRPLPQDADSFRGKLPKVVIVDEGALIVDDVFSRVIEPMFITHGYNHELIIISTPRGKSGYHYRKHVEDENFESFKARTPEFIPQAIEAGVVDPTAAEWLEEKRENTDDLVWQTEYLGEFANVGDPYLPREIVEPCVSSEGRKLSGSLFLGVDVAHAGEDRSVYLAVDSEGNVRVEAAPQTETVPEAVKRIKRLNERHRYSGIAVDATGGLGAAVEDYTSELPNVSPVRFTSRSKAKMYQRLKRELEGKDLTLPNDKGLIEELTSLQFSYNYNGVLKVEHSPGGHDDYPDALVLALEARNGGDSREAPRTATKPVLGTIQRQRKGYFPSL